MQTHYTHIHNDTHGTRERLILIPVKTKWYIFPSAGQAWDVHHHVYRDYENLIHNIRSNVLLTKHTDEKMHWTMSKYTGRWAGYQKVSAPHTIPTSLPLTSVTLWPCVSDLSVGGLHTDQPGPWINTKWLFLDQLFVIFLFVYCTLTSNFQADFCHWSTSFFSHQPNIS